jgi:carbonic anhydrase/acetyltransferase-like protein (isoleucine patch superfamily)
MLIGYRERVPQVDPTAYVQTSAQVIGDVTIGAHSSVWFNVVIRADVHHVRIGARTNIQDSSTIHVTRERWPTLIGDGVTVGHGAILHGCRIGNGCLVGIGAIVLDGAVINEECLIAAGSLVTPETEIAPRQLVMGAPAKAVRALRADELAYLEASAANYVAHAATYREQRI